MITTYLDDSEYRFNISFDCRNDEEREHLAYLLGYALDSVGHQDPKYKDLDEFLLIFIKNLCV